MKSLTILCDADDTIENLSIHWLEELNTKYNKSVCKKDIKSWDITKAYPDLTSDMVLEPLYREDFWDKITPIDGSQYYLEKMITDGHEVYIVTASNIETSEAKTAKLISMFPFIRREQIIFTQNKQLVDGDVLIDDGVHNLINGQYKKFLFNQPGNADFDERHYGITRVYSWKEVYEKISELAA